ncbi:MAG: ABC-F family ATP-binding cassette domain-containing protein [Bacteroidales bacterium]|nr:ABC-F family ATP-binding cassette domain-containing protein [Clostridium sp.]MCM1204449.1 ABC-F family ATP-binding cassette domain-containing protein [Bacteroidales bacterium]
MVLACQNISKAYGAAGILNQINFHIEAKEKLAIVGINGAGKSTLLKIIMKEEEADEGRVVIGKDITVGYLAQHQDSYYDKTIFEELLSVKQNVIDLQKDIRQLEQDMRHLNGQELNDALERYTRMNHTFEQQDGYAFESQITGILKGLGFTEADFHRPVSELSGGQKTRVSLGRLLLSRPDVILLDEPTNHLDLNSIAWLENYLKNYDGAVIIVSHDRYFLDKIVTKVVELEHTRGTVYHGNYSYYAGKREEVRLSQYRAYMNQQAEIRHQEEVIAKLKQFNREKSIKRAESREKMLDKIERLEKPQEVHDEMCLKLTPEVESGNDVLLVEGLAKSYDSHPLFTNIHMDIKRGERVALIGNNGTGKTTILKIINRLLPKDSGKIILGAQVHIGYYDQEHQVLHPDKTIFDELHDAYPHMTNTRVRNVLAAFLFTGEDVFKEIRDLSGGERGRVSLAKLMLSNANFLILDEPTNHLDITSKEILENALTNYTGTILYVSHDRYFINRTATRILDLHQGGITSYCGNYDYYIEQQLVSTARAEEKSVTVREETENKKDWKRSKEELAKERKRQNDIKKTENRIDELEQLLASLNEEMALPENATDAAKLTEISTRQEEADRELEQLYSLWESLSGE